MWTGFWKRDFSQHQRDKLAETGAAMPDGSFPIKNVGDLHNAISLVGRASNPEKAKAHIISRAHALDAVGALPESWGVKKNSTVADNAPPNTPWDEDTQDTNKKGDLSVADLERDGGKLQPEDGPRFKRKLPKLT